MFSAGSSREQEASKSEVRASGGICAMRSPSFTVTVVGGLEK